MPFAYVVRSFDRTNLPGNFNEETSLSIEARPMSYATEAHHYQGGIVAPAIKSDDARESSGVPPAWRRRRVTLDEIAVASRTRDLIKPRDSAEWTAFKAQVREADEIWLFTSPEESFLNVGGQIGYVIVRNGEQVEKLVVLSSAVRLTFE